MSSYDSTLRYLYGLQYRGIKLGLRNIRVLLRHSGNPHRLFPSIHIAGTNGKGSTAALLASVFMEAGVKTGLYTSPHLVRFTERIRVDGREVDEAVLVREVRRLRPVIERLRATFFEVTTCIAFTHFRDEAVEVAVIETGLGGRFDATNVLTPLASVITTIDLEHTDLLGKTIEAIAREKAGIIKRGVPAVTNVRQPEARAVLRAVARRRGSHVRRSESVASVRQDGHRVRWSAGKLRGTVASLGFAGAHQLENARLALAALQVAGRGMHPRLRAKLTPQAISRGLSRAPENSGLRGRLEVLGGGRLIADVAHNPSAMDVLVRALRKRKLRPAVILLGALADKDVASMVARLKTLGCPMVAVRSETGRGMSAGALVQVARAMGIQACDSTTIQSGVRRALRMAGAHGKVLVTGSHYVVGPVVQFAEGAGRRLLAAKKK
jgi:dihydrofolate synthase/folylpolyglutamate synthase